MTAPRPEPTGRRHLRALGGGPRAAGGAGEDAAQRYVTNVLSSLGFGVVRERFEYSAFPGRYATPMAGAVLTAGVIAAGWSTLGGCNPWIVSAGFATDLLLVGLFARWMLAHGVLSSRWLRTTGTNLVATRGERTPSIWLMAHVDSKSQPVPSVARVGGAALLLAAVIACTAALAMKLLGWDFGTLMRGAMMAALAGGVPVMASTVGARSDGAVDNASGVAAVLAAAALVGSDVALGVLVPSAEELGLAGVRAWVLGKTPATAINCDGVDDVGALVVMHNGRAPSRIIAAVDAAAPGRARVRRMPIGLLTDSTALAAAGWETATVSHGSLATLRRIHTSRDSLENLRGDRIDDVAVILARAVEALGS